MSEALVLGVGGPLVSDELDLDGLHRGHGQDGLRHPGPQAAQQLGRGGQVALLVHHPALELLEGPEPDRGLGDAAVHKNGEATVEAPDAALLDGLLGAVGDPLVLAELLVQLQLGLDVLGGVGDADLDTTRDAARDDALQELHRDNVMTSSY